MKQATLNKYGQLSSDSRSSSFSRPQHYNPAKPWNKPARAKAAKDTINNIIPHILKNSTRARDGAGATEMINYSPYKAPTSLPSPDALVSNKRKFDDSTDVSKEKESVKENASIEVDDAVEEKEEKQQKNIVVPRISVIKSDTYDAAHTFVKEIESQKKSGKGGRVAVLNMASALRPGGGVLSGALAQEESLCMRSTLYPALKESFYRLPRLGGLYTPDILVFRDSTQADLPKSEWWYCDVISVAATKGPDVIADPSSFSPSETRYLYANEKDKEEMILKIRLVLQMALQKNVTHLVLGALGCGAYRNPPREVAKLFKKALLGDGRKRGPLEGIESICFAIFDDGENLKVFREAFPEPEEAKDEGDRMGDENDEL